MDALQPLATAEVPHLIQQQAVLNRVVRRQLLLLLRAIRALGVPTDALRVAERTTGSALATAARTVAARAEEPQEALAAHGTPPAFRTDLTEVAQALEAAIDERVMYQRAMDETGPRITVELQRGRMALDAMEVLVLRIHGHDAATWAAWRSARKVGAAGDMLPFGSGLTG